MTLRRGRILLSWMSSFEHFSVTVQSMMLIKLSMMLADNICTNDFDSSKQASLFWTLSNDGTQELLHFMLSVLVWTAFFGLCYLIDKGWSILAALSNKIDCFCSLEKTIRISRRDFFICNLWFLLIPRNLVAWDDFYTSARNKVGFLLLFAIKLVIVYIIIIINNYYLPINQFHW